MQKGYTEIMENVVYIVTSGGTYDNERIVSVHMTLKGAQRAAKQLVEHEAIEEGMDYTLSADGMNWTENGNFIRVGAYTAAD